MNQEERVEKFLHIVSDLRAKGALYFQLDGRVITSINQKSAILNCPILKIADKDFNIISRIDTDEMGVEIASIKNILAMFNLQEV